MIKIAYSKTVFCYIILGLIFILATKFDFVIQDHLFYDNKWIISKEDHRLIRIVFYKLPKFILAIIGVGSLILLAHSYILKQNFAYRRIYAGLALSIIFVATVIPSLKSITNIYCPNQLAMYDGDKPPIRLFDKYPTDFYASKKGKCYPAGHASGGFALFFLYFAFAKNRKLWFTIALFYGWSMGLYQMLSGSHFISDTILSMYIALIMTKLISKFVYILFPNSKIQ